MAKFKRRVLGVLDRIYNIIGDQTPMALQVETPISFVHDVSREAELGSGMGVDHGYAVMATWGVNHAGASTERYVIDPYFAIVHGATPLDPNLQITQEDIDAWLISFAVVTSAATQPATRFDFGYVLDGDLPPYDAESVPTVFFHGLAGAANVTYIADYAGTGSVFVLGEDLTVVQPPKATLPFRFPHKGRVSIVSVSTGICNVFVNALLWIGARGATPPGAR